MFLPPTTEGYEKVMFSVCLSVHWRWGGGGNPVTVAVWGGGVTLSLVLLGGGGGNSPVRPVARGGTPVRPVGGRKGHPVQVLGQGYPLPPPGQDQDRVTPPPPARTGHAAGGTPLVVTQNFPVLYGIALVTFSNYKIHLCRCERQNPVTIATV